MVFNHRDADYQQRILAATGDRGVDVILEMLANVNLGNDLKLLAQGGRVVVIGSRGDVQITPRDIMSREALVMGLTLWLVSEAQGREIHSAIHAIVRRYAAPAGQPRVTSGSSSAGASTRHGAGRTRKDRSDPVKPRASRVDVSAEGETMPAYVIANVHVTDPSRYEEYRLQAQATIAAYGGRYLARGGTHKVLEGGWTPARLVILEFDSYDRAIEWYESKEYAVPKDLRQRISISSIAVVDGVSSRASSV